MPGIRTYLAIYAGLVAATIIEVVIRLSFAEIVAGLIIVLLLIAGAKAVTIAMYYQHLRFEPWRLSVLPIAAVVGVALLGLSAAYSLWMGMW